MKMIVSDLTQELEESNFREDQYRNLVVVGRTRDGQMFAITGIDIQEASSVHDVDRVVLTLTSPKELGLAPSDPR